MVFAVFTKDGFGGAELQIIVENKRLATKEKADLQAMGFESSEVALWEVSEERVVYRAVELMEDGKSFAKAKAAALLESAKEAEAMAAEVDSALAALDKPAREAFEEQQVSLVRKTIEDNEAAAEASGAYSKSFAAELRNNGARLLDMVAAGSQSSAGKEAARLREVAVNLAELAEAEARAAWGKAYSAPMEEPEKEAELFKAAEEVSQKAAEEWAKPAAPSGYDAAQDLANRAADLRASGSFLRAACFFEAAAQIDGKGRAHDFRVSADLCEREASSLLSRHFEALKAEARRDLLESMTSEEAEELRRLEDFKTRA